MIKSLEHRPENVHFWVPLSFYFYLWAIPTQGFEPY
nr:MAG TPA: Protein of unknown function (DUF2434) [Caudoviricetes sp.]